MPHENEQSPASSAASAVRQSWPARDRLILGYTGALALNAGFVNAVALLFLAFPVGNLTAVSTQLGMNTANPWLYDGGILVAILLGFLTGAVGAGAALAPDQGLTGPRHAVVFTAEALLLLIAALGVGRDEVRPLVAALGVDQAVIQAFLAATALGLQNGLTSSFRGMAVRTTHFTGTVTDLGLILGRSRRHGVEKLKTAILAVTLLLFIVGGVAGLVVGVRLNGYALIAPAAVCAFFACGNWLYGRKYGAISLFRDPFKR